MNWIINTFGTSIGKKFLMALSGACFIGFLLGHLGGNITLYFGKDTFNSYAEHLHALGILVTMAEISLLSLLVIHVLTGIILFFQNLAARPQRYVANKRAGGRTWASATMPYTGVLILSFVLLHLINFHFVKKTPDNTIFDIVSKTFAQPGYMVIYIIAMIVVALHVSHGFWSLFQTLGANHPKYMPIITKVGIVLSLVFGIGFGLLPIYVPLIAS
ncbi:MAG: succinate dehydrogenase cytochrome b subunit [Desulfobacula sp.]|nr:succinate dehydrogenase cytochrome b subunit [Desulfobacula sp.]